MAWSFLVSAFKRSLSFSVVFEDALGFGFNAASDFVESGMVVTELVSVFSLINSELFCCSVGSGVLTSVGSSSSFSTLIFFLTRRVEGLVVEG